MKLASKVRQIRDKLGKVITAPKKTGAHTPMKRLECWFDHVYLYLKQLPIYS